MEQGRWHRGLGPSSLPPCLRPSAGMARRSPTSLVSHLSFFDQVTSKAVRTAFRLCGQLLGPQSPHNRPLL